jgi:hypothetical protein
MTQQPQSALSKQGEEMVKRLLLIADLLAKGTTASPNGLQKPQESCEKPTRAQSHVSSSL